MNLVLVLMSTNSKLSEKSSIRKSQVLMDMKTKTFKSYSSHFSMSVFVMATFPVIQSDYTLPEYSSNLIYSFVHE